MVEAVLKPAANNILINMAVKYMYIHVHAFPFRVKRENRGLSLPKFQLSTMGSSCHPQKKLINVENLHAVQNLR